MLLLTSSHYIKIVYFFLNIKLVTAPKIKTGIVAPINIPTILLL